MKTIENANTNGAVAEPVEDGEGRRIESNLQLLRWLVDHELRAAERYRRFVTLLLIATDSGRETLEAILGRTKRDADRLFDLGRDVAIVMTETDPAGAMAAVKRYKELCGGEVNLHFSVVSFPLDGFNCADLMGKVFRRLNLARMQECGTVVSNG